MTKLGDPAAAIEASIPKGEKLMQRGLLLDGKKRGS